MTFARTHWIAIGVAIAILIALGVVAVYGPVTLTVGGIAP